MARVRLDVTNAFADVVGDAHGVRPREWELWRPRAVAGLAAVQARRNRDLRWLDLPYQSEVHGAILDHADASQGRFRNVVVLGIGGSALGTIALQAALNSPYHNLLPSSGWPRLFVLDNIDPDVIGEFLDAFDPAETLFNVISKSGATAETMAQFLIFRERLIERVGESEHREHLVVTTDEAKGVMRQIVERERYASFVVPDGVGGRYSVLSPVGLLPLALVGIDIKGLAKGAADMDAACRSDSFEENPAMAYAVLQRVLQRRGMPISVTFSYSQRLAQLGDWYAQLLAESLGKRRSRGGNELCTGPTPVRALGVTDQHSQVQLYVEGPFDKWFTLLSVDEADHTVPIPRAYADLEGASYLGGRTLTELFHAERDGTRIALTEAGRPNVTVQFARIDAHSVGQYLQLMEIAVAVMGELYDVDAFDQPGVEAGKIAAYALMGRKGYEKRRAEIESRQPAKRRVL
jgi:glucose-6-phosphate isomerase